jgi:hypothetical protein
MRRDMARLARVREQVNAIEQARLERLERAPTTERDAMVRMLGRVIGVGVETADMLVQETFETAAPLPATPASLGRPMRAGRNDARGVYRRPATRECVAILFNWRGASCAFKKRAPWGNGIERGPKAQPGSARRQ